MRSKTAGKNKSIAGFVLVAVLLFLVFVGCVVYTRYEDARYPLAYEAWILQYAEEYDLDPVFVAAVVNTESSFQPNAHSTANAMGLMQIQKDTFEWAKMKLGEERDLTLEDLYDPEINLQYGCAIYRLLIDEFGAKETAIAAYHAGWGNVKSWLADPEISPDGIHLDSIPFGDTAHYIARILADEKVYARKYPILVLDESSSASAAE